MRKMLVCELKKRWMPGMVLLLCTGCSGAPSVEVIGSFFPGWMFCIAGAIVLTGLIRMEIVRRDLERKLGSLVVLYVGMVVTMSCLLWLIFFS